MNLNVKKDRFEKRFADLQQEVYEFVKAEIIRVCDLYKWDFRCLISTAIYPRGSKLHDTPLDTDVYRAGKKLIELVFWADDLCGFPECVYESGKWIP